MRSSLPTPHDDSKQQQQNSVENIPHLLSRLRGLGSSSVEINNQQAVHTTSHGGSSTGDLLTMWNISNRHRRNSDGDKNLYSNHDIQSNPHVVNDVDDDSTASYGNNDNNTNNNSINHSKFSYFVRVEVSALSHYKICTADPQGDDSVDNWAEVSGNFSQSFFLDLEACRLAMTDRLITIDLTERNHS